MLLKRIIKQIEFIKNIREAKRMRHRANVLFSNRSESETDCGFYLALKVLLLAEHANVSIEILKAIKMALLYKVVGIDAGVSSSSDIPRDIINVELELASIKTVFGLLPENQAEEFLTICEELKEGKTNEAKFVKAMVRFEPVLYNKDGPV